MCIRDSQVRRACTQDLRPVDGPAADAAVLHRPVRHLGRPQRNIFGDRSRTPRLGRAALAGLRLTDAEIGPALLALLVDVGPDGVVLASDHGADRGDRGRGSGACLLYTSDAADDLTRVDLGGR